MSTAITLMPATHGRTSSRYQTCYRDSVADPGARLPAFLVPTRLADRVQEARP